MSLIKEKCGHEFEGVDQECSYQTRPKVIYCQPSRRVKPGRIENRVSGTNVSNYEIT